mgnify:CR=1 FL=1|jgi:hypothetical protein|tara:strand:+ start:1587 stop:2297 length:711 start_codon:yes stop_codon:yes gene_type:complete
MALPKLETPRYSCQLPSSGETVYYRPFLVGEQKLLLIAQESENNQAQVSEMLRLIDACCENININVLPSVDLEYLFLQIRIKSVGETSNILLECQECKEGVETELNLNDLKIIGLDQKKDNFIKLSDTITLEMTYPSLMMLTAVPFEEGKQNTGAVFKLLNYCVISITDGNEVFTRDDFTEKELDSFLENMSIPMLDKVQDFMNSVPSVVINHQYHCEQCQHDSTIELEGIGSFFV